MQSAIDVVKDFFSKCGMSKPVMDGAYRDYFTDETVWENVQMPTTVGVEQALRLMAKLERNVGFERFTVEILSIAAQGQTVLVERVDHMLDANNVVTRTLRLIGVLEVSDGKILAWRDYFHP